MDYLSLIHKRIIGNEKNVPGKIGRKDIVRSFCDLIGVKTPNIIHASKLEEIHPNNLPENFVLKPSFASTSIGVKLLRKEKNSFIDLIEKKEISWETIKKESIEISKKIYDEKFNEAVFLIEELLFDHEGNTPPQDIRFYAFQGEIGMILKEDHLTDDSTHAMYFDGNFIPFPDVNSRYGVAQQAKNLEYIVEAEVPNNWQALLNVAKRVSSAVPSPFARIDLYDTPNGIYLGEVTFTPGTFYYKDRKIMSQAESYRLGRMWLDAEKKLFGSKGYPTNINLDDH